MPVTLLIAVTEHWARAAEETGLSQSQLKGALHHGRAAMASGGHVVSTETIHTNAQLLSPVSGLPRRMGLPTSVN